MGIMEIMVIIMLIMAKMAIMEIIMRIHIVKHRPQEQHQDQPFVQHKEQHNDQRHECHLAPLQDRIIGKRIIKINHQIIIQIKIKTI